jgi:PmbA protein
MANSRDLETLTTDLITAAQRAGADAADALVVSGTSVSIEALNGKLEVAESAEGIDLGLRVLIGHKQATIGSSDIKPDTITQMAERAVAMAQVAPDDPHIGLAPPDVLATDTDASALQLVDDQTPPDPQELQEIAVAAEAAALEVKGVSKVQGSGSGYSKTALHLATSNGFSAGYTRTSFSTSCVAIAGEGLKMERDYYGEARSHFAHLPSAAEIGQRAGLRAVERYGPVKPPTGTYPVLFDERVSASLIGHLMSAINGTSITRGSSWLTDAMDTAVLPDGMDLIEDPARLHVSGSKPFDGEGLATRKRHIVEDGVLKSWTLDLGTARKLGLESTANAARGTTSPPSPSAGNLAITMGARSRDDLIADMGTGLLVTSMIGSTISPTTGDYSRGASGFWVEGGKISHPVNECTIAGNLRDMLRRIIPANDARTHLSRVVPSLLVEGMTIAGA